MKLRHLLLTLFALLLYSTYVGNQRGVDPLDEQSLEVHGG